MNDDSRLNHYLAAWDLAHPQLLTQTHTSHIYTVGHDNETVILKLLAVGETEERSSVLALSYFDGRGAVRLLRYDEEAQLLEYASGDALVTLVERGEDEEATRVIAAVIKQLHGVSQDAPHDGLLPLEQWFAALFDKAAADQADQQAGEESIYVRGAVIARRLLDDPREVRVLHGDIHHYNIRQSARGWLAFDPKKGLLGERTYDCANSLCNPGMPDLVHNETRLLRNASILSEELGLELPRILAFTYAWCCLNSSWWSALSGGDEIVNWFLKVARIVEPHLANS